MRRALTLAFALAAIAMTALAADNTLGTWKYNTAKSKPAQGNSPITNAMETREASNGGARGTVKGERADGTKIDAMIDGKYDGKPVMVMGTGLAFDTVTVKQINANTIAEERSKQGTKYHASVRIVVSADGKTLTATTKGTNADGKPITATVVWDKQ